MIEVLKNGEPLPVLSGAKVDDLKSDDGLLRARCTACGQSIEVGNVPWYSDVQMLVDLVARRHDCPVR